QPTLTGDGTLAGNSTEFATDTFRVTRKELRSTAPLLYGPPNFLNLSESITIPGGNLNLGFDNKGGLTKQDVTYSQGKSYKSDFTQDALGRIRSMHYGESGQNNASFDYDELGPITSATYTEELGSFTIRSTI